MRLSRFSHRWYHSARHNIQLCHFLPSSVVFSLIYPWWQLSHDTHSFFSPRNRLESMYLPLEFVIKIASAGCLLWSLCPRERRCLRNFPSSFHTGASVSDPESELDSLSNGIIGMGVLYSGRLMGGVVVRSPVLCCSTRGMAVVVVVDWGSTTERQCNEFDGRCPWGCCCRGCLVPYFPRDIGGEVPASDLSTSWDELTVLFTLPSRAISSVGTEGAGDGVSVKLVESDAN